MTLKYLLALCALLLALPVVSNARIKRNQSAKVEFQREQPCPATGASKGPCKGLGDRPHHAAGLRWQTVAYGKAKDKWERRGC